MERAQDADVELDWEGQGCQSSSGCAIPGAGGAVYLRGQHRREHDHSRGQPGRAEGAAAPVRGTGEVHLHRSAVQRQFNTYHLDKK